MRKFKHFMTVAILTGTMLVMNGCGNGYDFDLDKCEEVALQYLEEKYGKEFEVVNCWEARKITHSAGYAKVSVKIKGSEDDEDYLLYIYPVGNKDEDGDGYYDSYEVTSDNYLKRLVETVVKDKIDKLLIDDGLNDFFSTMGVEVLDDGRFTAGITSDFTEDDVYNLTIEELFGKYRFYILYRINVSEENYYDEMENQITSILKGKISNDIVNCEIYVYDNENYNEKKRNSEQGISRYVKKQKEIDFCVED